MTLSRISPAPAALAIWLAGASCDSSPRGRDASAPALPSAEISVRVDVPETGAPSVSMLAFHASSAGAGAMDVLGVVDPLVGTAPELGCERREVAAAARALAAQGGRVELDALTDVTLEIGPDFGMRPAARVYPALASVVSGVVAEAGPLDVPKLPTALVAAMGESGARESLPLPPAPRVRVVSAAKAAIVDARSPLVLAVTGNPGTFLEVRPFGATWLLACPVGPTGEVIVPAADLERIAQASGSVPVSLEAVWREARAASGALRLSLEVRSSVVVELKL